MSFTKGDKLQHKTEEEFFLYMTAEAYQKYNRRGRKG